MENQLNEPSKGEKTIHTPNRYNLRSKHKEGKEYIHDRPTRVETPTKYIANQNKEKNAHPPAPLVENHVPYLREILKTPSYFNYEHEIQKIRIPIPISELIKNEDFRRCLSKMLQPETSSHSTDSVDLQDENPEVILGPLV
jgi:hypothetical protein